MPSSIPKISGLSQKQALLIVSEAYGWIHEINNSKKNPGRVQQIAEGIGRFVAENGFTDDHLHAALQHLFQGDENAAMYWQDFLVNSGVFNPRQNSAITKLQQKTRLQAESQIRRTNSSPLANEAYATLYDGNIVKESTSSAAISFLILGDKGSGLTTLLKAFLYRMISSNPEAALRIISTEVTPFMGLEQSNVVTYVPGDAATMSPEVTGVIDEVYDVFEQRVSHAMDAMVNGTPIPRWQPYFLVIDNYSIIYENLRDQGDINQGTRAVCGTTLNRLKSLIQQGDKYGVTCMLSANSHKQIGLSYSTLRMMSLIAIGHSNDDSQAGTLAIRDLITDKDILPFNVRSLLDQSFAEGVNLKKPLIAAMRGTPRIAELPNYTGVDQARLNYGGALTQAGVVL